MNLSDNLSDWLFTFTVQIIGMGVIPLVIYKFWVKESIVSSFGIKFKISPWVYLLAIAIGIVLHFVIVGVSVIWQNVCILLGFTPVNGAGTVYSGPEVLVMSLLCTAVLPGIFEEITYRGLGLQMLDGVNDERTKVLVIGLLFGLGHQFVLQTGYAFVAGMVFAYVALKCRSIVPGMIIHFLNNAISVISEYSRQKNGFVHAAETVINNVLFHSWGSLIIFLAIEIAALLLLLYTVKRVCVGKKVIETQAGDTFYYGNSPQCIDDIFGVPTTRKKTEATIEKPSAKWYEYAFLYGSIAVTWLITLFTFIWGVWR